ncbi:MAG: putative toxin-antitoxin system toxin component, PIN family [Opitutales bacterium]|jgi:putative PIN family toxin of toxin-antitoxin system
MLKTARWVFLVFAKLLGFHRPKRVVLDTNVLIAAAWNKRSASRRLVDACLKGRHIKAVLSPALRREYDRIIKRAARKSKYRKSLERLVKGAEVVDCDARTMGIEVPADPEDAKVLATAVAGRVDALVGNDHHLLDLAKESSVPILRPSEFLRRNRL